MPTQNEMNYLAYGSNMYVQRMKDRGIGLTGRYHVILPGYRLEFNKIASSNPKEGYANIVVDKNECVEGVLYDIDTSDLGKLDQFEGCPEYYAKITIKVRLDSRSEVEGTIYIAQPHTTSKGLQLRKKHLKYLLATKDVLSKDYHKTLETREALD